MTSFLVFLISFLAVSNIPVSTSTRATFAPSLIKVSAMAFPIPLAPPVTIATRSLSLIVNLRHAPRGVHGSPKTRWIQGHGPEPHMVQGELRTLNSGLKFIPFSISKPLGDFERGLHNLLL